MSAVYVTVIASLVFLLCFPCRASEEGKDSEAEEQERTELVFSYSRQEAPKEEAPANISVITREDIEKLPATSAAEVLQYVPGVHVGFAGGPGSEATAYIQGSDVRHVTVYQDGVPLNQLANPRTNLSQLPIDAIERIEVYKGAASSAWGSSLGGVINIITREPDLGRRFTADILSSYGQFDTLREVGTFSASADRLSGLVSVSHRQSGGFTPHTDYREDSGYAKINYYIGQASRLNLACFYDDGRAAYPGGLLEPWPYWSDAFQKRSYQRLLFESPITDSISWTIEGRHYRIDASWDDIVLAAGRLTWWEYSEESLGISSRMTYDTNDVNRLLLGLDGDWGDYYYSPYRDTFRSSNWAFYLNDTYNIGRFSFSGGVRYDRNLDFGSEVSPSGGVVYRLMDDRALIRALISKGFSAPPGAWLHNPTHYNEDLKPEVGINYQLGAEARLFEFIHLEASVFRADIDDFITRRWIEYPIEGVWENVDEVRRLGAEGSIRADFRSGLGLSFGASFVDVRDEKTGDDIEDVPVLLLNAGVHYTYRKWMTHSLVGKYIDHNSSHEETRDKVFMFDYLLKCKVASPTASSAVNVFFAVHDLTDSDYLYMAGLPLPGRWLEGGLILEF